MDRYGGDCSGAESFLVGLQSVRDYFKRGGEILCRLLHAFSSEAPGAEGDPARAFQTLNCRPSTSYIDVCARTDTGLDFYSNEQVPIEEVDYYGAGFICKDISRMNTRHPKSLDIVMTSSSGMSTRTLHASKTYILKMQPKKFMIENVYRLSVIDAFLDLWTSIAAHVCHQDHNRGCSVLQHFNGSQAGDLHRHQFAQVHHRSPIERMGRSAPSHGVQNEGGASVVRDVCSQRTMRELQQ